MFDYLYRLQTVCIVIFPAKKNNCTIFRAEIFEIITKGFFTPQINENCRFRVQKKWVFGCLNKKTNTTFCRQLYPKMVEETLVSCEYHYRVSFGQILKIAYFMLIFGRFLLIKSQNQNPMVHSVNF